MSSPPLAIMLMGPTASRKTAVALALAEHIPCEIISVDSAAIYRGMNIGTAKPSAAALARVPHHLIDIIDPAQAYSAMQFRQDALALIQQIHARGKLPLLVGGTMLYFHVLQNGLHTLPAAHAELRAKLDQEAAQYGIPALHARLKALDPVTADRLKPNDHQRIQRALEVMVLTGQPMSALLQQQPQAQPTITWLPIALEPAVRTALHERIAQRFDDMLQAGGLLDEVASLRARGDLHPGLPSMRCVGYRQAWAYLDGRVDFDTMRVQGIVATRSLAKKQLTWLRSMPQRIIIDCDHDHDHVVQQMLSHMQTINQF